MKGYEGKNVVKRGKGKTNHLEKEPAIQR